MFFPVYQVPQGLPYHEPYLHAIFRKTVCRKLYPFSFYDVSVDQLPAQPFQILTFYALIPAAVYPCDLSVYKRTALILISADSKRVAFCVLPVNCLKAPLLHGPEPAGLQRQHLLGQHHVMDGGKVIRPVHFQLAVQFLHGGMGHSIHAFTGINEESCLPDSMQESF